MKISKHIWIGIVASVGMFILILDAKTALNGASDGVKLCLNTVIPALFPFFLFSILLNNTLLGAKTSILRPLGRLLGIPTGAEPLLLIGLIGGYPVGAQCITDAYRNSRLTKADAHRMLGFCSNAGPAFIFGMGSCIFDRWDVLWLLWVIHIFSAVVVGIILPDRSKYSCTCSISKTITVTQALEKSIRILAAVCGWIIIFRVLLAFLNRWCLWLIRDPLKALFTGILELANGCHALPSVVSLGTRFVLCSAILGFGGLCVLMQTYAVTDGLGIGMYFPGKVMQCGLSIMISGLVQSFLLTPGDRCNRWYLYGAIPLLLSAVILLLKRSKKRVEILC